MEIFCCNTIIIRKAVISVGPELYIAVCDDFSRDKEQIVSMTEEIMASKGVSCVIDAFDSGKELLTALHSGKKYQILLLDVMMDGLDGMELARLIRLQGSDASIVFISVNRELALYGYEVSAVRYLAKPLEMDKLTEALQCCMDRLQINKEILLLTDQGYHRISIKDIQYIEAFDRRARFMLANQPMISKWKFSEALEVLPKSVFLQCHRAYAVNLTQVTSIRNYEFILRSKASVPISRDRYAQIYKTFTDYLND